MNKRYTEKNLALLIGKFLKLEKACDEKNKNHPYITRKKMAMIDAWNLFCEQINTAEEFLMDYKAE